MEHLVAYNRKLLANILPVHVAEHFLCSDKNADVSYYIFMYYIKYQKSYHPPGLEPGLAS